jgi:toxin YoeB
MAKRKIIWSKKARIRLLEILQFYYERNSNNAYPVKVYSQISKAVRLLEKQPEIGRKTDFGHIRGLIVKEYIIFYEIFPETILIHTIWDCSQNPGSLKI